MAHNIALLPNSQQHHEQHRKRGGISFLLNTIFVLRAKNAEFFTVGFEKS